MKISQYKVDRVVDILSLPIQEKLDITNKAISIKVTDKIKEFLGKELIESYEKYKNLFKTQSSINISPDGDYNRDYNVKLDKTLPDISCFEDYKNVKKFIYKEVKDDFERKQQQLQQLSDFKFKVSCILTELSTYSKIKKEFPEAYQALLKVD